MTVLHGDTGMTYRKLACKVAALARIKNVETSIIGRSVCGKPIHAFHVGQYGENQVIITGAIHAREWITALLTAELVKIYSKYSFKSGGIYFIPLCNPDGVSIALDSKPLWKANARGVDLNVNFDADWGKGMQNVKEAGAENFIGAYPNSEPEVNALVDFTLKIKPQITVAYHSKGEVIYYGFEPAGKKNSQKLLSRMLGISKIIGDVTGYKPEKTQNSTGGYSDWVVMQLGVPAITIEVGNDNYNHPIGEDKLSEILAQNIHVPSILLNISGGFTSETCPPLNSEVLTHK